MIVANSFSSSFPNMFLRVQVWTGGWEKDDLQTRIVTQKPSSLPRHNASEHDPKDYNRQVFWCIFQKKQEKLSRDFTTHYI